MESVLTQHRAAIRLAASQTIGPSARWHEPAELGEIAYQSRMAIRDLAKINPNPD